MKHYLIALLLLLTMNAGAQTVKNNQIVIGSVDSVRSKILNETRKIWVYVPEGAKDSSFARKRYPVIYLLDGDGHFPSLVGMIQQLSQVNGNTVLPEMIVVAIPNTNRWRDLTPTTAPHGMDGKGGPGYKMSGGGEKFIDFISKELMPHIDATYPTAPYKIFIGHSFGGITVMNALINHTNMFNSYVAIDPSMWWHDQKLLNEAKTALQQKRFAGKTLHLGIANTMKTGMDTLKVRADTSTNTLHIRSILRLKDLLQVNKDNGLQFAYNYYPNDGHSSVPLIAEYDALRSVFNNYAIPPGVETALFDAASKVDPAAMFTQHYEGVSRLLGYTVHPDPNKLDSYARYLVDDKLSDRAYSLLALNLRNYPKSFKAYASMGEYYAYKKDKPKAVEHYRKALAIKDVREVRDNLNEVLAGK